MHFITTRSAILIAAIAVPLAAAAQPYCANYNDGQKTCGIASLTICEQSVSGVGGYCGPDQSSQIAPNLIQQWRQRDRPLFNPNMDPPSESQPGGLDWMPPPPGLGR